MVLDGIAALLAAAFFAFVGREEGWGFYIPALWFTGAGIWLLFQ